MSDDAARTDDDSHLVDGNRLRLITEGPARIEALVDPHLASPVVEVS